MPDITMCSGDNCPMKQDCYRFKAVPFERRQSYFAILPLKQDGSCSFYWSISKDDERLRNALNRRQKEKDA